MSAASMVPRDRVAALWGRCGRASAADGTCKETADAQGRHTVSCKFGAERNERHDHVAATLAELIREIPGAEVLWLPRPDEKAWSDSDN